MDGTGRQNGKAFDSLLNPTLRPATSHLAVIVRRRRGQGDRLLHFLRDIVVSEVRYLVQTLSLSLSPSSNSDAVKTMRSFLPSFLPL